MGGLAVRVRVCGARRDRGAAGNRFANLTLPPINTNLVLTRSARLPIDPVCQRLTAIATHNLREKMESKGVPFARECRVIEVCNPQQPQEVEATLVRSRDETGRR